MYNVIFGNGSGTMNVCVPITVFDRKFKEFFGKEIRLTMEGKGHVCIHAVWTVLVLI